MHRVMRVSEVSKSVRSGSKSITQRVSERLPRDKLELLMKNRNFIGSLSVVLIVILLGLVGPFVTRYDPYDITFTNFLPPSWDHLLGTDELGRDVFAELVYGIRNSLFVGLVAIAVSLAITLFLGGLCPYKGGFADDTSNVLCNVFLTLPLTPLLLIISASLQVRSVLLVAVIVGFFNWPGGTRMIRSQVLSLKERNFVKLARVSGKGDGKILFEEIFPNMLALIFIRIFMQLGSAILAESGISLIGLGPSKSITIGIILHNVITSTAIGDTAWPYLIAPGVVLLALTGGLIMMGSTMDEVLNPRLRGGLVRL